MDIDKLKQMFGLKPLPEEGGFFAESYRSDEKLPGRCLPERYSDDRCFGTAIYFLLTATAFSALHKLRSDEINHFYLGDPVEVLLLRHDGTGQVVTIGTDFYCGIRPQMLVPRCTWQGLRLRPGGQFALMGTTVAPGFEFADFELANRESLLKNYPSFSDMIRELTR